MNRRLFRYYEKVFNSDKLYEHLYSKHFKRTYAGKPTKRYNSLMQKIEESKRMNYIEKGCY
ncbi:hypothetical protein SAMN04487941_3067 [Pontibacter akesuensis]|uniref:Uncharacterized protein n=1 Tax=Pontibacter akesuensis TaxID=388950 RepID=A0A1I7JNM7_9BACT|nr:hypothetical protein GCM10007389_22080 [Pontibacter akesuensis]SFU86756.1 hypothetical protein SAMN04487941_3067 [Pontibacter akesuensis]